MASDKNKKTKRPTAIKRDAQNLKRRLANKSFKASVRTTIRSFEESLVGPNKEVIQSCLDEVYSIMDKGVKKGVFKVNKASRTKSRLTARLTA